ncbi:hypothetical protein JYU34_002532 [Plutella xylostella]|uniref:Uncharacterized protein n=1 Tax=Plutella xylostella TaxID=51655 RepID=A0ABQ7R2H6_PLUXY|nr:hypothetical protein JYU34_002532 [Plutella xylostella]
MKPVDRPALASTKSRVRGYFNLELGGRGRRGARLSGLEASPKSKHRLRNLVPRGPCAPPPPPPHEHCPTTRSNTPQMKATAARLEWNTILLLIMCALRYGH